MILEKDVSTLRFDIKDLDKDLEIRKGYQRIVDALVWAKNHGYEVKEGK